MKVWVVKVGTSLLRGTKELSTYEVIKSISSSIASCYERGDGVILVTSGAVGLGCDALGLKERPEDVVALQATAAVGQGQLMTLYQAAMKENGYNTAQILLTRSDLESRKSYRTASKTLKKLLEWGILPIVNENDTLSAEELKYGDNDTLSALVASALNADQLIILTDVDRLYSSDPRLDEAAKPITDIHHPNDLKSLLEVDGGSNIWGTGGMTTKLEAARIATSSGIEVHLADGRNALVLKELLHGSRGGTVFHANPNPIGNRKNWLAHALQPVGMIQLDTGACDALKNKGASLLLVGITKIEGEFAANQPVRVLDPERNELARGLSSFSSETLRKALASNIEQGKSPIVIHRDVLVLANDYFG